MRIGQKLLLGFLGIALLTGVVGYVGFRGTHGVFEVFDVIVHETAPEMIALGQIDALSRRLEAEAVSFALITAHAPGESKAAVEELEEFHSTNENLDRAIIGLEAIEAKGFAIAAAAAEEEEAAEAAAEEELLRSMKDKKQILYSTAAALIEAAKEGIGGERILDLKEGLEEAEERFEEVLSGRMKIESVELERRDTKADKLARGTTNILIVVTIGTVIFAMLLGSYISRAIASRITKLRDGALGIGRGKLNTRIAVDSRDEIGELAASFNKMAGDLGDAVEKEKKLAAATATADAERLRADEFNKAYAELTDKTVRLERFQKITVGRELAMVELKKEVNDLLAKLNRPIRYETPEKIKLAKGKP